MADDAIVSTTVTVLPDEIAKNFTEFNELPPQQMPTTNGITSSPLYPQPAAT